VTAPCSLPLKEARQAGDVCPLCFAEGLKSRILDPKNIARGVSGRTRTRPFLGYPPC
jgi:hypothetical protein